MSPNPSGSPIDRISLARMENRLSFLYLERVVVNRDNNALTISDKNGTAHVPATQLAALLLGPGTKVTHAAISLLGDSGVSIVWVGENGVRYYAHGRAPAKSSRFAEIQAKIWSNQRSRLACARRMYQMRFPGEDVSRLTMAQLRGREGARMKQIYATHAKRTDVHWERRQYNPNNFESGDPINRALTTGAAALYGVTHAVVAGLGFLPSLGIIHSGTDRAFIYDIADLYKAEISIPAAFDAVAQSPGAPETFVRRAIRDRIVSTRLLPRMVQELQVLMQVPEEDFYADVDLVLWSEFEQIMAGQNWESRV